jgi:uncharacterized protein
MRCLLLCAVVFFWPLRGDHFSSFTFVPMRDGTELYAVIWFPTHNDPLQNLSSFFDTVYVQTPYGAENEILTSGNLFCPYGYVVLVQDMRGRGKSEGEWSMWRSSGVDGNETIHWITQQIWSSGRVVAFGISADAIAAGMLLIPTPPPSALKSQFLIYGSVVSYPIVFQNGLFRESLVTNWLDFLGESSSLKTILNHEQYDEWWYGTDLSLDWMRANVSGVHVGGWYDIFSEDTIIAFNGYQVRKEKEYHNTIFFHKLKNNIF